MENGIEECIVVRYDMMIGVTSAEAFVLLNSVEMELGLESETRNKLVSDLVTWSPS